VFNIGLNYDTPTERRDGEAYFGYGDDIATITATGTSTIKGFICNWAGPGNSHTLKDYFQRQHITFNDGTGKWRPSGTPEAASSSNITFAPTNSCTSALGSAFYYDKNADNSIADELAVSPNPAVAIDLAGLGASLTIPAAILARGMTVPAY